MAAAMRLAFREEGDYWRAYAASEADMEHALLLGQIALVAVVESGAVKRRFMDLMQETFEILVRRATGTKISGWSGLRTAPAHERRQ